MISLPFPRAVRHVGSLAFASFATLVGFGGCSDAFPRWGTNRHIVVTLLDPAKAASPQAPLPLSFSTPAVFPVRVSMLRADGSVDDTFNGFVRLSSKPGTVSNVRGNDVVGRNIRLTRGLSQDVEVSVLAAYGETRLWAMDAGYDPADPSRSPGPACSNGKDDDGDGTIDFPTDPGCAFANDDSEVPGSNAQGASPPLYFVRPRIADVRGVERGGVATPFKGEQVTLDTGYRPESGDFAFDTIVTRIAPNGFYVADVADPRGSSSVFLFTFSAPPRLRICDRLKTLTGTATEFYGMTQLGSPTWLAEYWDPRQRPCLVPAPTVLGPRDLQDPGTLFKSVASLVRVVSDTTTEVHIASKLGAGYPKGPEFRPTPDATNCDFNRNGKVDFGAGSDEGRCSDACAADVECAEYTSFAAQSHFDVVVTERRSGTAAKLQVNSEAAPRVDVLASRGKPIRAFTGTLSYFSGGSQFTLEARCDDDVVLDLNQSPMNSDRACVRVRTELEAEAAP